MACAGVPFARVASLDSLVRIALIGPAAQFGGDGADPVSFPLNSAKTDPPIMHLTINGEFHPKIAFSNVSPRAIPKFVHCAGVRKRRITSNHRAFFQRSLKLPGSGPYRIAS